jgi:hypothetical protein
MPYIGNTPALDYISYAVQNFTVTAGTTSYALDYSVSNENDIRLVINNVIQRPGASFAYSATGTTLTLTSATLATDTMYAVFIGRAVQTVTPPTSSVTNTMLTPSVITGQTASTTLDTSDSLLIYDDSISALRKQTSAIFQTVKKITVNENITTQYSGLANGTHTLTNFNVTHTALSTSNKLAFLFSTGYYYTSGTNVGITEMYLNNGTSNVTESIYYDFAGTSVSGGIEKSIFAGYFNLTPASTNAITYTIRIVIYRPSGSSTVTVGASSVPARLICVEYI